MNYGKYKKKQKSRRKEGGKKHRTFQVKIWPGRRLGQRIGRRRKWHTGPCSAMAMTMSVDL